MILHDTIKIESLMTTREAVLTTADPEAEALTTTERRTTTGLTEVAETIMTADKPETTITAADTSHPLQAAGTSQDLSLPMTRAMGTKGMKDLTITIETAGVAVMTVFKEEEAMTIEEMIEEAMTEVVMTDPATMTEVVRESHGFPEVNTKVVEATTPSEVIEAVGEEADLEEAEALVGAEEATLRTTSFLTNPNLMRDK